MTEPQHDQPGKPASRSRGAGYDNRLATIDKRLDAIDARMVVVTWMYWTNLALTAGRLWRVLSH